MHRRRKPRPLHRGDQVTHRGIGAVGDAGLLGGEVHLGVHAVDSAQHALDPRGARRARHAAHVKQDRSAVLISLLSLDAHAAPSLPDCYARPPKSNPARSTASLRSISAISAIETIVTRPD